ncbi:hypothetical protein QFC21_001573 [Naganishia friedmannii]|uniref:Uncharacterized protein n=1 Tax=Naganishia friedmannii TaxID=89922 RepID=A0ACC2W729_9TREE|nr:hypothetical protein QFC21_001573 [Naganishia friedmannii]
MENLTINEPAEGGQIKLVETAAAIRMVLADVTHSEQSRDEPELAVLTSAFGLAKRFDMKGSMAQITIRLCDHNDGPALLVWACDQVPIDRLVSRCALVAFTNEAYFEMLLKLPWCSERASCHPRNLERTKLEALSKDGYIAYSRAWGDCAQQTGNSIEFVDWGDMANAFINNLKQMRK